MKWVSRAAFGSLILLALLALVNSAFNPRLAVQDSRQRFVAIGLPLLVLLGATGALRMREPRRSNLALVVGSTVLTLYLFETLLAIETTLRPKGIEILGWDLRSGKEVLDDYRAAGRPAVPTLTPALFLEFGKPELSTGPVLPMAGVPNQRTIHCNETGEWITYQSDRHGFNNPDPAWDAPSEVVMLLGDSFGAGICVNPEDSIAGRLRRMAYRIVNVSTAGSGPLIQLGTLREYGAFLRPCVAVWLFYEGNDLGNLVSEGLDPILSRYIEERTYSQQLAQRRSKLAGALLRYSLDLERDVVQAFREGTVVRTLKLARTRRITAAVLSRADDAWIVDVNSRELSERIDDLRRIVVAADSEVAEWGGQLLFAYLPSFSRYSQSIDRDPGEIVLEAIGREGIPTLDVREAFSQVEDPRQLFSNNRRGGHYNPQGYGFAAEAISEALRSVIRGGCPRPLELNSSTDFDIRSAH